MPNIKATQRGHIHAVVMCATSSHNAALPSSGKAEALKHDENASYLDSSKLTSSTSPGFIYSASSSC